MRTASLLMCSNSSSRKAFSKTSLQPSCAPNMSFFFDQLGARADVPEVDGDDGLGRESFASSGTRRPFGDASAISVPMPPSATIGPPDDSRSRKRDMAASLRPAPRRTETGERGRRQPRSPYSEASGSAPAASGPLNGCSKSIASRCDFTYPSESVDLAASRQARAAPRRYEERLPRRGLTANHPAARRLGGAERRRPFFSRREVLRTSLGEMLCSAERSAAEPPSSVLDVSDGLRCARGGGCAIPARVDSGRRETLARSLRLLVFCPGHRFENRRWE